MRKYQYNYNFNRPYPIFAEGGGSGGGMMNTRGMMDQQKIEKKVNHTTGTFMMDAGKWMLNQALTPLETIAGREFYEPEFNYSGWDKADAVTSGIASAATDIVGTYFGGPFYGMAKKATSSTLDKVDPENKMSYRPGEAQTTEHGGDIEYKVGKRVYKTRGSVSNRTVGNTRKYDDGTGVGGQGWQNFANILSGNTGNTTADNNLNLLFNNPNAQTNSGNSGGNMMGNLAGAFGGNQNTQNLFSTYGKASTNINPSELTRDVDKKGASREWSGLDGGLISTWTDDTPQQTAALAAFEKQKNYQNSLADDDSGMKMYTNEGTSGQSTLSGYGNDMNNAFTDWANSRTSVGNDTWNKVGTTIAKVGSLASNFVGGGGAPGGDGSAMFSGGGGSNSMFSGGGGEGDIMSMFGGGGEGGGFDMNQMMSMFGGGEGGGGGGFDMNSMMKMFGGGGGGQGGGGSQFDIGSFAKLFGGTGARDGGNIKYNDMKRQYNDGTEVSNNNRNVKSEDYSTTSTLGGTPSLPPGVTWDGTQYNVDENFNGTFNVSKGKTHDDGGTLMNVPAEGEGITTIEAEKGEVAEVDQGESYIWSKNKVPGTKLTFATRKNNRDNLAHKIESELTEKGDKIDEYRKNTLLRQLLTLEVEENSDKELQANVKRKNELNDRIELESLLVEGRAIAKNGTYVKKGKNKKLTAFQESIYNNTIMRMGTEVKYENGDDVKNDKKPKKPTRPFGNPTDHTYQKKMRAYQKAMKQYQTDLKTWNASESGQENVQKTEDVFDVVQNPDTKEWEYKVNGEVVDAATYDQSVIDWEANPTASNPLLKEGKFDLEKNQIVYDDQGNRIDFDQLQNPDDLNNPMGDLVPTYNAEGTLSGWKAPEETQDTPGNIPPIEPLEPIEPIQPNLLPPGNTDLPPPAQVDEKAMQDFQNQAKENQKRRDKERKAAAKGYDVNEEDLVYNDEGKLVPEKGTKNKTDGDTWGDDGWNDDAPEVKEIAQAQRQQDIIDNRNAALSPDNIPVKSLENVVPDQGDAEGEVVEGDAADDDALSAEATDLFNKGKDFKYDKGKSKGADEGGGGEDVVEEDVVEEDIVEEDIVEEDIVEEDVVEEDVVVEGDDDGGDGDPNAVIGGDPNSSGSFNYNFNQPGGFQQFYGRNIGQGPYDWLGNAGLMYGAQAGIGNTKEFWKKYQDLPNENFWTGVGDRRERRLNQNLGVIDAARKNTRRDLRQDLNTILRGNRNTASSFGNLNARDQNAFNTYAENSIDSDIKYGLMNLGKQSELADAEWDTDKLEHAGDWKTRQFDQEDLSGYYTQLGADKQNIAKNMMELGKNQNEGWANILQGNALNSGGGNFRFDSNGNIIPNNTGGFPNHGDGTPCSGPGCKHPDHGGKGKTGGDPLEPCPPETPCRDAQGNCIECADPNAVAENTETTVYQPQSSGYFKTTNEVGGLKEFSGDYSPINEDGSLNTGHYQEWLNIHKDPTGKKLSRLTQSGGQGNTTTYSDKSGVNVKPVDWDESTQGPWTQPFPGRDNTVGRNVRTTADWYGEDYLRHLIETGQYNPEAVQGEQGYTSGLLTGEGSGTYQIPLNPDSKTMESSTTFEGGEDLDPTTWNQTQKDAWLLANPDATIEDAITKYNPVMPESQTDTIPTQEDGGSVMRKLTQMMGGGQGGGGGMDPSMIMKMVGGGMRDGTKVKRYDEGDHVHTDPPANTKHPITKNVRQDYHDLYSDDLSRRKINKVLNQFNPSTQDTVFMQSTDADLYKADETPTTRQTNMMRDFMLQNYTEEGTDYESMHFMEPFRRLFAPNPDGSYPEFPETDVKGVRGHMSSKVPLMENYATQPDMNVDAAIKAATPKPITPPLQEEHGGLVEYFKSEIHNNKANNRNLADQRISEFRTFMKNRK